MIEFSMLEIHLCESYGFSNMHRNMLVCCSMPQLIKRLKEEKKIDDYKLLVCLTCRRHRDQHRRRHCRKGWRFEFVVTRAVFNTTQRITTLKMYIH